MWSHKDLSGLLKPNHQHTQTMGLYLKLMGKGRKEKKERKKKLKKHPSTSHQISYMIYPK